ncbi:tetratricopeptide repeat protein [Pseudoduganella violaceinigra]|uniref:tetratricopeptide repeat protein n=1 Tax=Pseudoduganella violaceinigra TaxID=246602 RepID=UPI000419A2FF|nr:tetratricopeptide repeat protein [Pseudoduganella violaceinigra]
MTQYRFARIGLLLAAIGLSAVPALVQTAYAQDKAATDAKQETVRKDMAKLLDGKVLGPLLEAKKYSEATAMLDQADAMPDKSSYEQYFINRMRVAVALGMGDRPKLISMLEAVIASGRLEKDEKTKFTQALAASYQEEKNWPKAIESLQKYGELSGDPKVPRQIMLIRFESGDYKGVQADLLKQLDESIKANKPMTREDLHMLADASNRLKDKNSYLVALEGLVRWHPLDRYWSDMLYRTRGKENYSTRFSADIVRLQKVATTKMDEQDYVELAEVDQLEGQFIEGKAVLDAGIANGAVTLNAKTKKLKADLDRQAADDVKNIASSEASARKAKNGTGLVNLGYAFVTMGQYDKGIPLIQEGIAKGGLKNAEDAKLRLGYSYAMAGKKEEAIKILETVQGADGRADLARYWILWVNRPYAPTAGSDDKQG